MQAFGDLAKTLNLLEDRRVMGEITGETETTLPETALAESLQE